MLAVANKGSCVGPRNKIGHPAHHYRQLMQVPVLSARGIQLGCKTRAIVFLFFVVVVFFFFSSGFAFRNC